MDVAITSTQIPIEFTAYASSATTKGNPVDSNTEFQTQDEVAGSFEVSAYLDIDGSTTSAIATQKYFGFSSVTYSTGWVNDNVMYWPNYDATLYFGAISPKSTVSSASYAVTTAASDNTDNAHELEFSYTVLPDVDSSGNLATDEDPAATTGKVATHKDIMYAITEKEYTSPTTGTTDTESTTVNLHFKHALTQIAFTATKDEDINVIVSGIQLCNIMSTGTFTATSVTDDADVAKENSGSNNNDDYTTEDGYVIMTNVGKWGTATSIAHYVAAMADKSGVTVLDDTTTTKLTDDNDALMLIPQTLDAWNATTTSSGTTNSYLAITCKITHADGAAAIIDGTVYVPFDTTGINYEDGEGTDDTWAPGYKITYNLNFGSGYVDTTTDPKIPEPGETPDPDKVIPTLRAITYTTTVDAWESISATGDIELK